MKRLARIFRLGTLTGLLSASIAASADAGTAKAAAREAAAVEVRLQDNFWIPRLATNRAVTIPHLLGELEKQGSLDGFRLLAGARTEAYHGYMWGDSDVYKTLEGMASALRSAHDPVLEKRMEQIIATIAAAQAADGYLFPHLQITEPNYRHFADETTRTCESYSLGHLIESAVRHHRVTGRTNFLAVAVKAADLLVRTHAEGQLLPVSGHPEVELALLQMHDVTGNRAYLDLAGSLITNAGRVTTLWSQGRPPLAQAEAHGHAVAMLYLYAAATDFARLTGNGGLLDRMDRKWCNVVGHKLYLTGGLGHRQHGEGFGPDYDLPNDSAYSETCAAIANVFWQHRLFLAHGDAAYVDVLERSLYNNVLAGISLTGDRFFYVNPLAADGRRKFNQGLAERFAWTGCPCCPVNLVRVLPTITDYFYSARGGDLYVNLYAASEARCNTGGGALALRQMTRYPWEGEVRLDVLSAPEGPVTLRLRIPGWAQGRTLPTDLYRYLDATASSPTLTLNGQAIPLRLEKGYAVIGRTWRPGDRVELDLPMPIRRVLAHQQVKANAGHVALERGPLVYCVEGADNGGRVLDLILPDDSRLTAAGQPGLPGGVTAIRGEGQRITTDAWGRRHAEPAAVTFLPYYAWNHRGVGEMAVWLPRTARAARLPYDTAKWVGANYTPARAVNQVQMWHEFKPDEIERELAAAQKHLGLTTLRVCLHNLVYEAQKDLFLDRIETFLQICDRHGIRPGFTFFDDCWNHSGVTLKSQPPVDGRHNGRWAALQDAQRQDEHLPALQAYVQDVVRAHLDDPRVLWWETYNEPNLKAPFSVKLRELAYGWIKDLGASQPVIACWDDHAFTDIVNAHNYGDDFMGEWTRQAGLNASKGTVFTEAGARWYGRKPRGNGSPAEVIDWLERRQASGKSVPGVYLCWELMVGNSNCRWYWGTEDGAPEPAIPWCGLLWPDGTPVSYAEAEAIRSYTTGEPRALLFENFQSLADAPPPPTGWTRYAEGASGGGSGYLTLGGRAKLIAGETSWDDYLLEATVMLKDASGNAGLVFRVNHPGPGPDQMRGYYAGFSTNRLYLGKMNNRWEPLATLDLAERENQVVLDTWNLLRVAVQGPRIRVWFNPLHDNTAPVFDLRDGKDPVLRGNIGVRTFNATAWFDDVVVLPDEVLER